MTMPTLLHWQKTWRQLGADGNAALYAWVCACYSEPHRRYHTLQHLHECFSLFEQIRAYAEHPAEVELAIWFHDAIYDPASKDNEQKSAEWAWTSAIAQGLPKGIGDRVYSLIMATKHDAIPPNRDAKVLVDVDLGILAADPARFEEYEQQVRIEYEWVPESVYHRERRKILQGLMERSPIYSSPLLGDRYETKARQNLTRSLAKLT